MTNFKFTYQPTIDPQEKTILRTLTTEKSKNTARSVYLFGFNGKEKDDELYGSTGTSYNYGFRIYDSRIGRFLSVDPLTKSYPWYTPYQFAGNKPIWAVDLDGQEEKEANVMIQSMGVGQAKQVVTSSLDIQQTLWSDAAMVTGGVVAITVSLGAASPVIAGLLGVTGSYSIAGGITKTGLDIAGQTKASNVIPSTASGLASKPIDVIAGWKGKYAEKTADFVQNIVFIKAPSFEQKVVNVEQTIESGIGIITTGTNSNSINTSKNSSNTTSNNPSNKPVFNWSWEPNNNNNNMPPIPMKLDDKPADNAQVKPPLKIK